MKRGRILENICRIWLILVIGMCVGCGKNEAVDSDSGAEIVTSVDSETDQSEEQPSSTEAENLDERWNDTLEIDFAYDYSEDIKTDVDYMVSVSDSLQEELENIEKITQKYTPLAEKAQTQGEMNVSSRWLYVIWDTELNDLWNRFSKLADPQTKEQVLTDQRNWIAMKEKATFLSIGSSEENVSVASELISGRNYEKQSLYSCGKIGRSKGRNFSYARTIRKIRSVCRQPGNRRYL